MSPNALPAVAVDGGCDAITSVAAAVGFTVKTEVIAEPSPLPLTTRESPAPAWSMVRPVNVATPWLIVAVSVPPRLPAWLFAIETVTVPVAPVTSEPSGLWTSTVRPKPWPAVADAGGCAVTTRWSDIP